MSVFHNNALIGSGGGAAAAAGANITKSLRFNKADTPNLQRTPSSAGSRTTWTLSFWVKRGQLSAGTDGQEIFNTGTAANNYFGFRFNDSECLEIFDRPTSGNVGQLTTTQVFRDCSAWYHIVYTWDTTNSTQNDRRRLYVNGSRVTDFSTDTAITTSGTESRWNSTLIHTIGKFNPNNAIPFDGYLADIYHVDGVSLEPTSFGAYDDNGVWQAAAYSGTYGTNGFHLLDFENESTIGHDSSGNNNDFTATNLVAESKVWSNLTTPSNTSTQFAYTRGFDGVITGDGGTAGFAGWLSSAGNITITFPSGVSVSNTINIYSGDGLNGSTTASITVSGSTTTSSAASGYITNKSFSGVSGNLESITLTNAGGGVRFYGIQIDGTTLVDIPGSDVDVLFDVPTNGDQTDTGAGGEVSGNYAVINALNAGSNSSLTDGNLKWTRTSNGYSMGLATIGVSSGKWYYEHTFTGSQNNAIAAGIVPVNDTSSYPGQSSNSVGYNFNGTKVIGTTQTSYGATYDDGDVIGVAFDADNGTVVFYKNGVSQGTATSSLSSGPYTAAVSAWGSGTGSIMNFGQRPFAYSAPSNYKALCTANLPTPTIADGSKYFQSVLWNGNSSARSITTTGMSPDWVWIKARNHAYWHYLYDAVRGATKEIYANSTNAEDTDAGGLTAFNSDGFSLGSNVGINGSSKTFVGWCWDAGSSTASNTDGTITSSVRASAASGFSIVSYTGNGTAGATIGHSLNAVPELILLKSRDTQSSNSAWTVHHKDVAATKNLILNSTAAAGTTGSWNDTAPGSSVFTVGSAQVVNTSGKNYIAYCFSSVNQYSSFGKYTANGSSNGPFVFTGFRPAFVLLKLAVTGTARWFIFDSTRDTYNAATASLYPDRADAEGSSHPIDFLSNGFKLREADSAGYTNYSGSEYIYAAFAENPFQANGGLAR